MKTDKVIPEQIRGFEHSKIEISYTSKQVTLYALGVGAASENPTSDQDLQLTYELHPEYKCIPTFGAVLHPIDASWIDRLGQCSGLPAFNPMLILHGEQKQIFHREMPPSGTIMSEQKIVDVQDKGKGTLLILEHKIYNPQNPSEVYQTIFWKFLLRGIGGFGDKGIMIENLPSVPKRTPDKEISEKTLVHQALIYRLSGDFNPLHADPNMAAIGGYDKPILHGMCFYGFASRLILREFCGNKPEQFQSIHARFVSHVFPGETLQFSFWKEKNEIIFSCKTAERGKQCLIGVAQIAKASL